VVNELGLEICIIQL